MPHHVGRRYALRGAFVVSAAGRVNVMISGVPARGGGMNPAAELKRLFRRYPKRHSNLFFLNEIFRPTRVAYGIIAGLERNGFPIGPINLGMEKEVRRQPTAFGRIDPAVAIPEDGRGGRGLLVEIVDM